MNIQRKNTRIANKEKHKTAHQDTRINNRRQHRTITEKEKADSTLKSSRAVPHPSTNWAVPGVTSEVERDPVYSRSGGRQRWSEKNGLHYCECIFSMTVCKGVYEWESVWANVGTKQEQRTRERQTKNNKENNRTSNGKNNKNRRTTMTT